MLSDAIQDHFPLSILLLNIIHFHCVYTMFENDSATVTNFSQLPKEVSIHCLIYAKRSNGEHPLVLGILREDGMLGLPGGTLQPGESLKDGLKRELFEELNIDFPVDDHVIFKKWENLAHEKTYIWVHHLCMVEITEEQFYGVEKCATSAEHYGTEIYGIFRVPFGVIRGNLGFPAFLRHNFIGDCKEDILLGFLLAGLMSAEEIMEMKKLAES